MSWSWVEIFSTEIFGSRVEPTKEIRGFVPQAQNGSTFGCARRKGTANDSNSLKVCLCVGVLFAAACHGFCVVFNATCHLVSKRGQRLGGPLHHNKKIS
jgi:hypothetical protein